MCSSSLPRLQSNDNVIYRTEVRVCVHIPIGRKFAHACSMVTRHALARNTEWRQINTWLASCGMPDFCIYFVVSTTSFIHRSWVHLPANITPTWEKPVDTCVSTLMFDIARGNENIASSFASNEC